MRDEDKSREGLIEELEELRKRVAELEASEMERRQMWEVLKTEKGKMESIINSIMSGIDIVSYDYRVQYQNRFLLDRFGDSRGKLCYREYMNRNKPCSDCPMRRAIENNRAERAELLGADERYYEVLSKPLQNPDGTTSAVEVVMDITERRQVEEALREREAELVMKTNSLEEANTALGVLMRKMDEDKTVLEEKVVANVKELVVPFLEKVRKSPLNHQQVAYLDILESNLNAIISPFLRTLSAKYINLTPTEIQVANLIKEGNNTKKIGAIMAVSPRTIETHRKNIRRKLGLGKKKGNLRSYLMSFQ